MSTLQQQGFDSLEDYKEYYFKNGGRIAILQQEIYDQVQVTDDEIEDYYNNNQDSDDDSEVQPLFEVKEEIKGFLLSEKQSDKWNEYIAQLQNKADIQKHI